MIFNSFPFAIFFILFFGIYWYAFGKNLKYQNLIILLGSYLFYGWWDWRFLSLLLLTTLSDYLSAIFIEDRPKHRKSILAWTLFLNLGILIFFKYSNFFIDSFFSLLGRDLLQDFHILKIILPVGISFYTFQSIAYVVDVYRGQIQATRSLLNYAAYISFFPQLVAGPIERAGKLLPQIENIRQFSYPNAVIGCRLILWGFFKKIMIADNIAGLVDSIFTNNQNASFQTLWLGTFLFGIQIYCDFSAYSEIARGSAKLLGIELMQNFHFPYFARDIHQFWRRWHISLSTWFKDYIFIPLGGSLASTSRTIFNTFVVFFISGLWHGASARFIVWGIYHFILYVVYLYLKKAWPNHKFNNSIACIITIFWAMLGWVFFRAADLPTAFNIIAKMCSFSNNLTPNQLFNLGLDLKIIVGVALLFIMEFIHKKEDFGLSLSMVRSTPIRWAIYTLLILVIITYGNFNEQKFIYFDF